MLRTQCTTFSLSGSSLQSVAGLSQLSGFDPATLKVHRLRSRRPYCTQLVANAVKAYFLALILQHVADTALTAITFN